MRSRATIAPIAARLTGLLGGILRHRTPTVEDHARSLVLADGDRKGDKYDPGLHPAQICLMQAMDAGATWVAIAKPVQDGGSLAAFAPIMRRIGPMGQTALIAYPTMDAAKDAWTTKVWPMLAAQGELLPETGGGSRGAAARVLQLPSGGKVILRAAGGRGESGQASVTVDCMMIDEVDDWQDFRRLRLIERRMSKSPDPFIIYVSTVKRDGAGIEASPILRLFDYGSGTELEYPCPHCAAFVRFDWGMVDVERQVLVCSQCKGDIDEAKRQAALRAWRRKDARQSAAFSIRWSALDSPFPLVCNGVRLPVLTGLCVEFQQAKEAAEKGDHGLLRQFYRDRLTRPYTLDTDEQADGAPVFPTRNRLAAASAVSPVLLAVDNREKDGDSLHLAEIPAFVEHQAIAVDVQQGGEKAPGRLYFLVIGRGGGQGCITGYGSIIAAPSGRQPTAGELHIALDRMQQILDEWNPSAPIVAKGVDVGDRQDELLSWLSSRKTWRAIKGTGPLKCNDNRDRPGWMYVRQQGGGWWLNLVETHAVTRIVHGELLSKPGPGSLLIPRGLDRMSTLIRHLCATVQGKDGKWSTSPKDRAWHLEWSVRGDYLDCAAYARAMLYYWETMQVGKPAFQTRSSNDPLARERQKPPNVRRIGTIGNFLGA